MGSGNEKSKVYDSFLYSVLDLNYQTTNVSPLNARVQASRSFSLGCVHLTSNANKIQNNRFDLLYGELFKMT